MRQRVCRKHEPKVRYMSEPCGHIRCVFAVQSRKEEIQSADEREKW